MTPTSLYPSTVPATRPRFLPFKVLPKRPLSGGHGEVCPSAEHERTASGRGYVDRMVRVATASRAPTMTPPRSEPLYKSNEEMPIDVRPHTTLWGGGSTDSPRIHGGRVLISSAPPRTPRRIRPPPRQPKALAGTYRKPAIYKLPRSARKRHPPPRSATRDESRLCSSRIRSGCHREGAIPLRRGPDFAGGCSAAVRDEGGVCGGATLDPGNAPFVARWPDEEAVDGLMHGGLLWRESGCGRETELTTDGVPQEIAEACRPVRE